MVLEKLRNGTYVAVAVAASGVGVAQTFAAPYSLQDADVTALGSTASDTAGSFIGVIVDLLPVFIPVVVTGFVIRLISKKF